ncbi:MAG: AraC family transcriptional regulator [Pseudomonadota bacterium]
MCEFSIDDFLSEGEFFHFARKTLDPRKPKFLHRHDFHEVFLVTHGATEHWLGERMSRLEKGSLVFVRPGDSHALQAARGERNDIVNVSFRSDIAEHLGQRYSADLNGRFFWHGRTEPDRYQLSGPRFERAVNLSNELQTSKNSLAGIEEYLLALFTRVVEHVVAVDESAPGWLLAASAAAKRPEVFRQGAAGFVRAAGRGHEHVCRMARKHLGVSPSAYVNKIRMEHAALMLAGSDLTINDISSECGIENLSYFYKVFQRQYGTTPRQYRIHHQKNPLRAS